MLSIQYFLKISNNPCYFNQDRLFQKFKLFLPNLKDIDWKEGFQLDEKIKYIEDIDNDDDDDFEEFHEIKEIDLLKNFTSIPKWILY